MIDLWYADGPGSPLSAPAAVLAAAGVDSGVEHRVTLGWTVERTPWLDDPAFRARTVLAGYALGRAVGEGRVAPLPIRLSAVAGMIEQAPPEVAVVTGVRRGTELAFGASVGWADVLARAARRLVVEVDEHGRDLGGPVIEGNVVATIPRPAPAHEPVASRPADETDLRIGRLVASVLPAEPTLQIGPGGIGEGIARAVDGPARLWTGLITDAMAELHERGLLVAPAVAAYTWGGPSIAGLASDGMLQLSSATTTHDLTALSALPRFVACNTAVQVGLDGAVNVERAGSRTIAAVGGHADFCAGATRSVGGLSIIALRSTTAGGDSTIVARPDVVSTPRCDVDVVVTEHGVADLRGLDDREHAERLVAVASPDHRSTLADAS